MDIIELAVAIAILAGSVGGVAIGGMLVWAALKKGTRPRGVIDSGELGELRGAVDQLASEVAELQERVDFAERVLASHREAPQLRERT